MIQQTRSLFAVLAAAVLSLPLAAQQFQYQPGTLPGVTRWTEGVSLADVDRDGDLDILFAEGEGFGSAGPKRQNILIINQLVETGPGIYSDESVARLGVHLSNGKSVISGDVNGDGWVDLLYLNAFNTDPPSLYINRGNSQPGFFDLESSTRGFTENLSSADGQFGDLDDDGDLDVIIADTGPNFLGAPGGKPRLYINDGTGHFTEDAAALNAPTKIAQMDVQLVDIDGDWDLDLFMSNRGNNPGGVHYLMTNDGSASFTDVSSLIPLTSTFTYEAEPADLDGDTDFDFFFLSHTGFAEGIVRNDVIPSGSLGFTALPAFPGGVDDNEVAFIDHDNDGDLDALVGSLGNRERIYRNDGALAFTSVAGLITTVGDPTLDLAVGDLDGDGDYDVVTAQGEGSQAQWGNKFYLNTGTADDLAPVALGTDVPSSVDAFPIVVHTRVQDQVVDDSVNYLTSNLAYAARAAAPVDVMLVGGVFVPSAISVPTGTPVRFTNQDAGAQQIQGTTPLYEFDLAVAGSGGTAQFDFVRPGVYTYVSSPGGAMGQITVTGALREVAGRNFGGSIFRYEVPCFPVPNGEVVVEPLYEDFVGNRSVGQAEIVAYTGTGALGSNYCVGALNSSGVGGVLCATGSAILTDEDVTIRGEGLPGGVSGLFYFGPNQIQTLFGDGFRCVGGPTQRVQPSLMASGSGVASRTLNFAAPYAAALAPGSVNFQLWYRDPMGPGGSGFNVSDGLEIVFQ